MNAMNVRAASIVLILLVSGCGRGDLFEKPAAGSPPLPATPPQMSHITLAARIPFGMLQKAVDGSVPAEQSFEGSGDEPCTNVPAIRNGGPPFYFPYIGTNRACAGHRWSATVRKSGPVTVNRNGDAVRVAVPLEIRGKAGVNGDIAGLLALNGKNFGASVHPAVDLRLGLGKDWCPQVNATPTRNWVSSASVEIVGRNCAQIDLGPLGRPGFCAGPINLDLSGPANDALNGQQQAIQTAASRAVQCDEFRKSVQHQWRPIAIPVDGVGEKPFFLNIVPETFAFSSLRIVDDAVEFAVRAGVKAQLNETAVATDPLPLPAVEALVADRSLLSVALTAQVSYARLAEVLKPAVVGQSFTGATPAGEVKIRVEDVDVYPSDGRVVVGAKIRADLPGRFFDTRGWVYLIARPMVDDSGTVVRFGELTYATVIDNALWQAFATVFDEQIRQTLQQSAQIDLRPTLTTQAGALTRQINAASFPGGRIEAHRPEARLVNMDVDTTQLVAAATAELRFEVVLEGDGKTAAGQ